MIFAVDHFVLSANPEQAVDLLAELRELGFAANNFVLSFTDLNGESESLSYSGGGMVEVLHPLDPTHAPVNWFAEVPRIIGLGFASDDFAADTDWGPDREEGHWTMDEQFPLPDGSSLDITAAGPHRHVSEFYVFVMARPSGKLQFPDVPAVPRLISVTIVGAEAMLWRERLRRWLRLGAGPTLMVGDVELRFEESENSGVRISPEFSLPARTAHIPLARSGIDFVLADSVQK